MKSSTLGITVSALAFSTFAVTSDAAKKSTPRPDQTFAGAPLEAQRAARLLQGSGLKLIDFHPCQSKSEDCALIAAKLDSGAAVIYELSAKRCAPAAATCLGNFTVTRMLSNAPAKDSSDGPTKKLSGKPGEDDLPPDPEHEAQANANNEILESLAQGKYDGNMDQLWADLESIQTWTNPQWIEPDVATASDKILVKGSGSKPAVLDSNARRHFGAHPRCPSADQRKVGFAPLAYSCRAQLFRIDDHALEKEKRVRLRRIALYAA